jgi:protein ImuB
MAKPLKVFHRDHGVLPPPQSTRSFFAGANTDKLWLALTLTDLPLVALEIGRHEPTAIVAEHHKDRVLISANAAARQLGVAVGMKLNGALAIAPNLVIHARQQQREQLLLERMAAWSYRFTSLVSVVDDDAVVLEIGGSLRLFGSHGQLKAKLMRSLKRFKVSAQVAVAPTPLAALWLSRAGADDVLSTNELSARLGELPLAVLRWPSKKLTLLEQMGMNCLVDCFRLPRDGLGRRLGATYLQEIDRALGRLGDPQLQYLVHRHLTSRLDLDTEVMDTKLLLQPVEQLLKELAIKLRQAQRGADELYFELHHLHREPTQIRLRFGQPEYEYERFSRLFEDRLQRLQLAAPVVAVRLRTSRLNDVVFSNEELPMRGLEKTGSADAALLLQRLRARLGEDSVYGLCFVNEHRPEAAWDHAIGCVGVGETSQDWGERRPLWLLERPLSLVMGAQGPCYEGRLQIEQGPERIETGWWDGQEVARDYYIASNGKGSRLWIYRDLQKRQCWYLHGIFS